MLHLADPHPAVRQNLATGRVSERITGRGLAIVSARLSAQADADPPVPISAQFLLRAEGYFAFSILPERDMPDLTAAPNVTLRAEFTAVSGPPLTSERTVAGSTFALQESVVRVAARDVTIVTLSNTPIDLSVETDPAPVALQGIVLRNHDPAQPVAGVHVVAGAVSTDTDARGRFFLPALPLQADLVIELTTASGTTSSPFHINYEQSVNSVTLSVPD